MKTFKDSYVIIEKHGCASEFFADYISFCKHEMDAECEKLNKKKNDEWEKEYNKRKGKRKPFEPTTIYFVMDLKAAIELFESQTIDMYITQDESYQYKEYKLYDRLY